MWGALIGALLVFDWYRWKKNDRSTFSDSIRYVFQTDTPEGRAAFQAALALFSRHILR